MPTSRLPGEDAGPAMTLRAIETLEAYLPPQLVEASGLWFARGRARRPGLFSAGICVPFEIACRVRQPDAIGVGVFAENLAVPWLPWPRRAWP